MNKSIRVPIHIMQFTSYECLHRQRKSSKLPFQQISALAIPQGPPFERYKMGETKETPNLGGPSYLVICLLSAKVIVVLPQLGMWTRRADQAPMRGL